jgi:hypothetical protein
MYASSQKARLAIYAQEDPHNTLKTLFQLNLIELMPLPSLHPKISGERR